MPRLGKYQSGVKWNIKKPIPKKKPFKTYKDYLEKK